MKKAAQLDEVSKQVDIVYSAEENEIIKEIKNSWVSILNLEVDDDTDFFASGGGSMDVVRLVEEVKDFAKVELENQDVFLSPTLGEFCLTTILRIRGDNTKTEIEYKGIEINANGMTIKVPTQLFIDGQFVDCESGRALPTINPTNESVICEVNNSK